MKNMGLTQRRWGKNILKEIVPEYTMSDDECVL